MKSIQGFKTASKNPVFIHQVLPSPVPRVFSSVRVTRHLNTRSKKYSSSHQLPQRPRLAVIPLALALRLGKLSKWRIGAVLFSSVCLRELTLSQLPTSAEQSLLSTWRRTTNAHSSSQSNSSIASLSVSLQRSKEAESVVRHREFPFLGKEDRIKFRIAWRSF
jgi:hypothetical protein